MMRSSRLRRSGQDARAPLNLRRSLNLGRDPRYSPSWQMSDSGKAFPWWSLTAALGILSRPWPCQTKGLAREQTKPFQTGSLFG